MPDEFELSIVLPATPEEIYSAWLSSKSHTAMTGSPAHVRGKPGGKFTAWDGYIFGRTLELDPPRRIVQRWRTTEFQEGSPDSLLEILIEPVTSGTKLTLLHTNIPEGQGDSYRQGWQDFYFTPMQAYFGNK